MLQLTNYDIVELFGERLPALLEEQPELTPYIFRSFGKVFATKEEVFKVLAEVREFRDEAGERFDRVEGRLDRVEGRLDRVEHQAEEFRTEVQERFTSVETRMEYGFREVEQQAEEFRAEVEQRFTSLETRMEDGFREVDERFVNLEEHMEDGFREVQRTIDRLGSRWGIRNESIFRQTMAELLEKTFGYHVEEREIQGEQFDCVIHDGQHILVEISASVGPKIQERLERKHRLYTEATGVEPARVILVTAAIHSHRAQLLRDAGFEVIEPEEDTLVG